MTGAQATAPRSAAVFLLIGGEGPAGDSFLASLHVGRLLTHDQTSRTENITPLKQNNFFATLKVHKPDWPY